MHQALEEHTEVFKLQAVELVQRRFMVRAETLDRETWRARPLYRKVAENVARMVGSLL